MNLKKFRILLVYVALFSNSALLAQPGYNDSTFNVSDVGFGFGDGFNDVIITIGFQTDEKMIVGGRFTDYNNVPVNRIVRLNSNGQIDTSFHFGLGLNNQADKIVLQQDNKSIIGGAFTSYNGSGCGRILRLNEDGSADTSFHIGTGFNSYVSSVVIQSDGKIIVSGAFTSYNGAACNRIARLNSDGTIDNLFNANNAIIDAVINDIELQPDGKIVIIGYFGSQFARLNSDGSVDPTFNIGTGPGPNSTTIVSTLSLQSDGKIIIGGNFTNYNGTSVNRLVRVNTNGTIDNTFNIGTGPNGNNILHNSCVQSDGKIFIAGNFTSFNGISAPKIVRLNQDGSVDNSFQISVNSNYTYQRIIIQPDGKLILGFDWSTNAGYYRRMDRFNPDGTIDPSFNQCTGFNGPVNASILQFDGKVILGGDFTSYNGGISNRIVRINEDGDIDNTFNSGTGANNTIFAIAAQLDGKIIIGGNFTSYNGVTCNRIARLNIDGTLDNSFNVGIGPTSTVSVLIIQSDGKILVGGQFGLIQLNTDGTIDNSFTPNINSHVYTIALQTDGKIIVAGNNLIRRLNSDGSSDFSFITGSGANSIIYTSVLQSDGKLFIGGIFSSFNGTTIYRIARLNTDGSIDNTFNSQFGANGYVMASRIQADGKIIIGGSFNQYGFVAPRGLARLNSDGSYDNTFFPNGSDVGDVATLQIQPDGKAIIGGMFTEYLFIGRNRITRIDLCAPNAITINETACNSYLWIDNQLLSSSGTYVDTLHNAIGCDSIITLNLTIVPSLPLTANLFSQPSDANLCVGNLSISATGTPDFTETIDGGSPFIHSGYILVNDLCPGVHSLFTTNGCGDTLTQPFVIPIDSNYIFNNPFIDSIAVDSLGATIEDCEIYYNSIDTAYIDSIFANGNTVTVIWNIVDSNGSNFDTSSYVLNNGNGVYYLQLSVFCPTKALGDYFTVTEAIYFEDGNISTASLAVLDDDLFQLFPNPTNELVTIRFEAPKAELVIYDAQGKLVQTQTIQSEESISLGKLETGIYFFELTTGTGRTVKRVVKQ